MQTREKPTIVVHPDVAHLMKGPMIDIRDLILDRAASVSESRGVAIYQVGVRQLHSYDEDWSKVVFEIRTSQDDDKSAFEYWEAVDDAVWEGRNKLSKPAQSLLNEEVTIFVSW